MFLMFLTKFQSIFIIPIMRNVLRNSSWPTNTDNPSSTNEIFCWNEHWNYLRIIYLWLTKQRTHQQSLAISSLETHDYTALHHCRPLLITNYGNRYNVTPCSSFHNLVATWLLNHYSLLLFTPQMSRWLRQLGRIKHDYCINGSICCFLQ